MISSLGIEEAEWVPQSKGSFQSYYAGEGTKPSKTVASPLETCASLVIACPSPGHWHGAYVHYAGAGLIDLGHINSAAASLENPPINRMIAVYAMIRAVDATYMEDVRKLAALGICAVVIPSFPFNRFGIDHLARIGY